MELLAVLVTIAGATGLVWWRIEKLLAKRIAVTERKIALEEKVQLPPPSERADFMPDDLMKWASAESEPWAREQTATALAEMREVYGDWNEVRRRSQMGMIS